MTTENSGAGKGGTKRPYDQKKWDKGWTRIWGKKKPKPTKGANRGKPKATSQKMEAGRSR